jgi:hypothetical protein
MGLLHQQTEYISCHHLEIVSSIHLINVKIFQSPEIVQSQSRTHLEFHSTELKSYLNQGGALLMENQFYLYVQIHNERR